jgi:hypothetical protein
VCLRRLIQFSGISFRLHTRITRKALFGAPVSNAPGGVRLGKVWANHDNPDVGLATMPEGTVAAKLLFTTAPVEQVPWLAGSPEWKAYVYDPNDSHPRATSSGRYGRFVFCRSISQ